MKREIFKVSKEEIDDYTGFDEQEIKGEIYTHVDDYLDGMGDGESHTVVVQRKSDGKYFEFSWSYYRDEYYYEEEWCEVKPKVITKTIYKWYDEK